jgi:hypothetical protein
MLRNRIRLYVCVRKAKKASLDGPVFITDRGKPSDAWSSIEEYRKLTGGASEPSTDDLARVEAATSQELRIAKVIR